MKKLLLITFIFTSFILTAQINIKGIVVDALTNETLIGANVIIQQTNKGTATNFNGEYQITCQCALPTILRVSYLGYKTLDIEIQSSNPPPIKLFSNSKKLNEVKVVDSRITQKHVDIDLSKFELRFNIPKFQISTT